MSTRSSPWSASQESESGCSLELVAGRDAPRPGDASETVGL
jgi:hypothetical protein